MEDSTENRALKICQLSNFILIRALLRKRHENKRLYISKFNAKRQNKGAFEITIPDLLLSTDDKFVKYFRSTPAEFEHLYNLLASRLERRRIHRNPISGQQPVALTLRIMASGESFASTAIQHRIGLSTTHYIFHETTNVIWEILQPLILPSPSREAWEKSMQEFYEQWNFPNCLGAIDGKHSAIGTPPKSGSLYRNYKGFFLIVLLAIVDPSYTFLLVNIGGYGKQSDGGTFSKSQFAQKFETNAYNLPLSIQLPNFNFTTPPVLVGHEAFPLKSYLMRPYPGHELDESRHIFNYRLSQARHVVENTFRFLMARWNVFEKLKKMLPTHVDSVVKAAVCLHYFIKKSRPIERDCFWRSRCF